MKWRIGARRCAAGAVAADFDDDLQSPADDDREEEDAVLRAGTTASLDLAATVASPLQPA